MLRGMGYWPLRGRDTVVCPKCGNQLHPPIGRPDLIVLVPMGIGRVIEAKVVDISKAKSFAFSSIRDEQNSWLDAYMKVGGLGYLAIGTVGHRPRRLWIIDWEDWRTRTSEIESESIPVDASYYERPGRASLTISNLFPEHELVKNASVWQFVSGDHSLLRQTS